jgi:chaperonin GroES
MKAGAKSMNKIPSLSECNPGIKPTEYNVLIVPEDTEQVTAGGIILATTTKEANDIATMKGRLVAVSPHAFTYADNWPDGTMPQVGDAVLYAKYAGTLITGADGKEYRLAKDKDVAAILEA